MSNDPKKILEEILADFNRILGGFGKNNQNNNSNGAGTPMQPKFGDFSQWTIIIALVLIIGAFSSYYQIDTSQQGVITRFGKYHATKDPGPHFKIPFGVDRFYPVHVTRIHELQFGFRKKNRLSSEMARRESLMLTGDENLAVVEWIVQYKITNPRKRLFSAANVEKNIRDVSISVMRRVVGDKLVDDVITKDREEIAADAMEITQGAIDAYDMGVTITNVALQNVTPPPQVEPAYNAVNTAVQEQEKIINNARKQLNTIIPEAEGKAKKLITDAQAYKIEVVNRAKGDANRFTALHKEYEKAPSVTKSRLYLEAMNDVFSNIKKVTIVDDKIKGLLPIFGQQNQNNISKKTDSTKSSK